MLMNSNELVLSINKRLQDSGIIDDVTDFFHEHPEYFNKCVNSNDIISSCSIDLAMCCRPRDRLNAGVFTLINIGTCNKVHVELSDHSRSTGTKVTLKRSIDGKEVSEYVCN